MLISLIDNSGFGFQTVSCSTNRNIQYCDSKIIPCCSERRYQPIKAATLLAFTFNFKLHEVKYQSQKAPEIVSQFSAGF